jgi:formylmethanofuran dehydrogenase subunit E
LREFGARWGDHTLEIVVHAPLATPYTCLADGLTVATGNSIGRLDIRLAEELSSAAMRVSIRSKIEGRIVEFQPSRKYLRRIAGKPAGEIGAFARETVDMPEAALFEIRNR